jgi:hypothetical protein
LRLIILIFIVAIVGPMAALGLITAYQEHIWGVGGWLSIGYLLASLGCFKLGRSGQTLGTILLLLALIRFAYMAY